jgi:GGDEF domain-containing protein
LRGTDLVARVGDEFRVLLPRCSAAEAMVVAGDLCAAVRSTPAAITCSVGVAPFSDPDDAVGAAQRARAAVDEVRRDGGDAVAAALVAA